MATDTAVDFRVERRPKLSEGVVSAIRAQVVSGVYAPGQKLPTETRMGELFGVSRTVVREAIATLAADGLVEARQGAGVFVVNHPASTFGTLAAEMGSSVSTALNVLMLFLGTFMDMGPMIIITTPIFLPVAQSYGIDPVHFGVIMILNLGIGLNTPPVGAVQFVACAVGKITVWEAMRSIWPFYGAGIVVLGLVTYIPAISLWLPSVFK